MPADTFGGNIGPFCRQRQLSYDSFQLVHISGPRIALQKLHRLRHKTDDLMGAFGIKLVEVQTAQGRDLKDAFPQRRHPQRQTGALLAQDPDGTTNTLLVKIPAGIESGKSIRLRGKGHTGSNGRRGDLLLKVNVEEKKGFERRGMDIYTTIQIPYTTAVFGGEARVSTLYGDVVCKIKEGTQSGSKLRLRGKGMVSMKDANVHGDHYATIEIAVPRSLNRTARQKLMEYKEAC